MNITTILIAHGCCLYTWTIEMKWKKCILKVVKNHKIIQIKIHVKKYQQQFFWNNNKET